MDIQHVAIIMDGNRRWAKAQGKHVLQGHSKVVHERIEELIERAAELQISHITFWAFSTENWGRAEEEIGGILRLFRWALERKAQSLIDKGAQVRVIGDLSRFPEDIRNGFEELMERSKDNSRIVVTFALNYGGRDEMVRAMRRLFADKKHNGVSRITAADFEGYLDTAGMPDPDLIIRTGGEQRMSGFLPWQGVYAEYYFPETYMPDFDAEAFDLAIGEYERRNRRFGKG